MGYRTIVLGFASIMLVCVLKLGFIMQAEHNKLQSLTQRQIRQDILVLLQEIKQYSAFYSIDSVRLHKKINLKISQLGHYYPNQIPIDRFTGDIVKIMALLADPSVIVRPVQQQTGMLPIGIRPEGKQWLALDNDLRVLAPKYPYLSHIDNIPLSTWIMAAKHYTAPQLRANNNQLKPWLTQLDLLRHDIGLPIKDSVILTLTNDKGSNSQMSFAVSRTQSSLTTVQATAPLEDPKIHNSTSNNIQLMKIGDISLYQHSQSARAQLQQAMLTPRLVLDMRDAEGYSDWFMATLSKYDRVRRANQGFIGFGRYRLSTALRSDYLRQMNFVSLKKLGHTDERLATHIIKGIDNTHGAEFGKWFARTMNVEPGFYLPLSNRLTLIIGPQCRQDCQWLTYYAKSWPNATLVGEATVGKLARQHYFELPQSGLKINMSASLSYDNQGKRVSGVNTEPDIILSLDDHTDSRAIIDSLQAIKKPSTD